MASNTTNNALNGTGSGSKGTGNSENSNSPKPSPEKKRRRKPGPAPGTHHAGTFKKGVIDARRHGGTPADIAFRRSIRASCQEMIPAATAALHRILGDPDTPIRHLLEATEMVFNRVDGKVVGRDVSMTIDGSSMGPVDATRLGNDALHILLNRSNQRLIQPEIQPDIIDVTPSPVDTGGED